MSMNTLLPACRHDRLVWFGLSIKGYGPSYSHIILTCLLSIFRLLPDWTPSSPAMACP